MIRAALQLGANMRNKPPLSLHLSARAVPSIKVEFLP